VCVCVCVCAADQKEVEVALTEVHGNITALEALLAPTDLDSAVPQP
jgi:hypothetical protein